MMEVNVVRADVSTGRVQKLKDCVAEEKSLSIFLNRTHFATILCSPTDLKELAVGYVLSEGIVKSVGEIKRVSVREDKEKGTCRIMLEKNVQLERRLSFSKHRRRLVLSTRGGTEPSRRSIGYIATESPVKIKSATIAECVGHLNTMAEIYRKTGGTHAAAIFKHDGVLRAFAEDVSRHNAIDKVIGIASMKHYRFEECFLASTGRLTREAVSKAVRVRLPVIASLAAAMSSGVSAAVNANLTLIGFVRGKRMNIYSFPDRILS